MISNIFHNDLIGMIVNTIGIFYPIYLEFNNKKLDIDAWLWYPGYSMIEKGIMDTVSELKKFDAVLRMTRFSTKRKGNDKKRISKKLCRKKVRF